MRRLGGVRGKHCRWSLRALGLLAAACCVAGRLAGAMAEEVDLRAIAAAGDKTMERLKTEAVGWESLIAVNPELKMRVSMRHAGSIMRADVELARGPRLDRMLTIIARDKVWYVDDGGRKGKFRPYEAPLARPVMYTLLRRAEIRCLSTEVANDYTAPLREKLGRVSLQAPLPERKQEDLSRAIAYLETFPDEKLEEISKQQLKQLVSLLKSQRDFKLDVEVDVKSGLFTRVDSANLPMEVDEFKWGEGDDPDWSKVVESDYTDYTEPLSTDATGADVAMFCHQKGWKPGVPANDSDVTLANFKIGAARRVPFPLGSGLPGCFSKDRHKVYMTGADSIEGTLGLYEIDLTSGATKPLAPELWNAGSSLLACDISPDGRSLAALRVWPLVGFATTVVVIDLQTGEQREIGEPLDTPSASWFPDGKSLLVVDRGYHVDAATPPQSMVCRLGLDGKLDKILPGKGACMLGSQSKMLVEADRPGRLWQTCDLQGDGVKTLGDGLSRFDTPSPAPDGKKILMMQAPTNGAITPLAHLIDSTTGRASPLRLGAGRWTRPKW